MILIGYWTTGPDSEYPDPKNLMNSEFYKKNWKIKSQLTAYIKSGKPCNFYRGFSSCRICGKILGSHERTDGTYIWPDQLEHYILEHNVLLPQKFIDYVMTKEAWPHFTIDDSFWLDWAKTNS